MKYTPQEQLVRQHDDVFRVLFEISIGHDSKMRIPEVRLARIMEILQEEGWIVNGHHPEHTSWGGWFLTID